MAERMELTRPVFFVGFMGAGKTSVARRLARTSGVASVEAAWAAFSSGTVQPSGSSETTVSEVWHWAHTKVLSLWQLAQVMAAWVSPSGMLWGSTTAPVCSSTGQLAVAAWASLLAGVAQCSGTSTSAWH